MTHAVLTARGTRNVNEDSVGVAQGQSIYLFVLADGLGGHGGGEIASKLAVDATTELLHNNVSDALIQQAFINANQQILDKQLTDGYSDDMKTTMVCLTITNNMAQWGHVGDSRLYLFRDGKPLLRTLDHSVPQALVLSGRLDERKIRFHEDRNRLIRALGIRDKALECDIAAPFFIQPHDVFLLCSDGLWEWVDERQMSKTLKKSLTPNEWLTAMEKILLKRSKKNELDNYSAIAVYI